VADADAVFDEAELIVKVKEPQPEEVSRLRREHTLFTYLHLAPEPELTEGLVASGATCLAYETVEGPNGQLPLLAPMSEVAGRIATQAGAFMLERPLGGRGVLLGGVPGVAAANVVIIGGGVVGFNAATVAIGMAADVFVLDNRVERLRELDLALGGRASTVFSSTLAIEELLPRADLVIGAVLVHGARAPWVVRREQLGPMKERAVLVDVAIDQGGCFETSRPYHALRPDVHGGGRDPLLRGQHAGCGPSHLDVGADQRDPPLRACAGRPRRGRGAGDDPGAGARGERGRRPGHPPRRGRGPRARADGDR
jgi:Alanine dehydrogenase